jgi:beta-glucosidase
VAWPRIFPTGTGQPNLKGLDFYSRLTDELLASGIEPFATLYHWDLPQALQDSGGWLSRDTTKAFADYSGYVAEKVSDRIKHFFTINEFLLVADGGHRGELVLGGGAVRIEMAPGLKLSPAELNQVRHHVMLAHGLSVQAIRAMGERGTRCGPADNTGIAVPVIETPDYIKAAERATRELNAPFATVMMEGKYTDEYLTAAGKDAPIFSDQDLRVISTPVDFMGINLYQPRAYVMASAQVPGYRAIPLNASHPRMVNRFFVSPEVLYWGPRMVHSLWNPKEIFITENGCATSNEIAVDGSVFDTDRVMFLRNNLLHLQRATADGIPVKGYFHWSLMDNFEWTDGFSSRFGLAYVDFATQKRTPKLSASYFREAAAQNAVV